MHVVSMMNTRVHNSLIWGSYSYTINFQSILIRAKQKYMRRVKYIPTVVTIIN